MKATSLKIVESLRQKGFTAYFAGGCVRDILLNKSPKDIDIATDALPEQIEELFEKTYPIGKAFGVILVHQDGHSFEVATFRSDSGSSDGRRPDYITFTSAKEDAIRRDFTINALFFDPITDSVIDFVEGQPDIKNKIIRFVGDPETRIKEDFLRLIRGVRFKNSLGFEWDEKSYEAIKKFAGQIDTVSFERIRQEFCKILLGTNATEAITEMYKIGMLQKIIHEIENLEGVNQPEHFHKEGDVLEHSFRTFKASCDRTEKYLDTEFVDDIDDTRPVPSILHVRLASLLHDIAKPITASFGADTKGVERIKFNGHAEKSTDIVEIIMKRLRFSNADSDRVVWLTSHHMMLNTLIEMDEGNRNKWFRHVYFPDLMEVFFADIAGTVPADFSFYDKLNSLYAKWQNEKDDHLPRFLNGNEIMEITGLKAGKKLGEIIHQLENEIHAHRIKSKEEAIYFVSKATDSI